MGAVKREVELVILCEDGQHEAFVRRFLELRGWDKRKLRVSKCPPGTQSAEQWVRTQYPLEVNALRKAHVTRVLLVVTDADGVSFAERKAALDRALGVDGVNRQGLRVALIVPSRNIETWLSYLTGIAVNETDVYPRLVRERDCSAHVNELHRRCRCGDIGAECPPSLKDACEEIKNIPRTVE